MPSLHGEREQGVDALLPRRVEHLRIRRVANPRRSPACRRDRACRPSIGSSRARYSRATPIIESFVTMLRELVLRPAHGVAAAARAAPCTACRRTYPRRGSRRRRKVEAHLAQHGARLAHDARAVLEVLVPVRRQADDRERGARAQRAADHVVHAVRVLQHDQMPVVRGHGEAELGDGVAAVGQQALAERGIRPRLGHHARAVARNPFLFDQARVLVDEVGGLHAPRLERGFERRRALVNGGRVLARPDAGLPCRTLLAPLRCRRLPGLSMSTPTCATQG